MGETEAEDEVLRSIAARYDGATIASWNADARLICDGCARGFLHLTVLPDGRWKIRAVEATKPA